MTSDDFRAMALGLPATTEAAHMHHPDFRVGGKIFATLGYPRQGWGMVKLAPQQQEEFVNSEPDVFIPAAGAWGGRGATTVRLRLAKKASVRQALELAWRNIAPKRVI